MGAIVAFLKSIYEHKEKVILGILIVAFVGVAFVQLRGKFKSGPDNENDKTPEQLIQNGWKAAPTRKAEIYRVPQFKNAYPLDKYVELVGKANIFAKPVEEKKTPGTEREKEWVSIRVKSIFDPTQSGSYIAIIEVDKRSRIVREGQQFEGYEVKRIDAVRNCLTISRRGSEEEREFCKEE